MIWTAEMTTKELAEKLREDAYLPMPGFQDYELPDDEKADPCPFCSGDDLALMRSKCDAGWWYHVECVACIARGPGVLEHVPSAEGLGRIAPHCADDTETAVRNSILAWNSRRHTTFLRN